MVIMIPNKILKVFNMPFLRPLNIINTSTTTKDRGRRLTILIKGKTEPGMSHSMAIKSDIVSVKAYPVWAPISSADSLRVIINYLRSD